MSMVNPQMNQILNDAKIPDRFPGYGESRFDRFNINHFMKDHEERQEWCRKGMFAFVSWEWVEPFAKWIGERKCLEVMAGAGWLAKALREKGIDVIATDNHSWKPQMNKSNEAKWQLVTEIEEMDCVEAVKRYGKEVDILIVSWPYMDDMAYHTLKTIARVNHRCQIVYIGEGMGGCTARDNFFLHFKEIEDDELFNEAASKFSAWDGIHDRLVLGKYQKLINK